MHSDDGHMLHSFKAYENKTVPINDILFSGRSESLVYALADGAVKVWDSKIKREIHTLIPSESYSMNSLTLDQISCSTLATGNSHGTINLYNYQQLL